MHSRVESTPHDQPRRGFLAALGAIVAGTLAVLTPLLSGVLVVLHPVLRRSRRSSSEPTYYRVAHLTAIPADGHPRQYAVTADQRDAWTLAPNQRIGAIYLRRAGGSSGQGDGPPNGSSGAAGTQLEAFNVVCPHAGCFVGYHAADQRFHCPCHNSAFNIDGAVIAPSPSPRGLDRLDVKVDADGSVWVAFQNFYAGRPEKVART